MIWRGFLFSLLLTCGCTEKSDPSPLLAPPLVVNKEYYPLEVGCRWEYRSQLGLKIKREVAEGTEGEWKKMIFTLPLLGEKTLSMKKTPEGIMARRENRNQLIMRFPMKVGESWTIDFPGEELALCTVERPETVEILGKAIPCTKLRVDRTDRKSKKTTRDFEWYAEGIGLVQVTVTVMKMTQTFTLTSYTPAGDSRE